jgi:hypothetical protein
MLEPYEIANCTPEGDQFRGPIVLTYDDKSPVRHLLVTESPQRGRRNLGARMAPNGNWNDGYEYRCQQGHELALRIAGSTLAKDTGRLGYRTMVCPKLEYQCDKSRLRFSAHAWHKWGTIGTRPKRLFTAQWR